MRAAIRVCMQSMSETARSDLAESPRRYRQVSHRVYAGVHSEAKGEVIVAAGSEQGERPFEMFPRLRYSPANQ